MDNHEMTIFYDDRCYESDDINEIKDILSEEYNVKLKELKQKSEVLYPIIGFILTIPIYYFSKGFFSKIGESLGEEVAEDLKKSYKKFKNKIAEVISKQKTSKIPLLKIDLIEESGTNISIFIKSNKNDIVLDFLDNIEDIHKQTINYITDVLKDNIKKFVITFKSDGESLEDCYYINNNNEVFSLLK